MLNPFHPTPAPPAFGKDKVLPESKAPPWSRLLFSWLDPFLSVGYSRPLEKEDLWDLPESRRTAAIANLVQDNFYKRCPPEKRPRHLRGPHDSSTETGVNADVDKEKQSQITADDNQKKPQKKAPVHDSSLFKALFNSFRFRWIYSGLLLLGSETLRTTSPLISRVLLTWLTTSYVFHRLSDDEKDQAHQLGINNPQGIGYGIGLAFALFAMQEVASLMMNHYYIATMKNGLYTRTGLIGNIFRKSLRLSGRARNEHSVGQITTMISTDTTNLDGFCSLAHYMWVAPIQLAICIGLLIRNLGVSALVGLAALILAFPVQTIFVIILFKQRSKGVKITDARIRLISEVLQGIRLIKAYAWESFYSSQLGSLRTREIKTVKTSTIATAGLMGTVTFAPVLAATLSFVTYALTGHDLNVAIVFSSLMFFNAMQAPLLLLPVVLSAFASSSVALNRIAAFLLAEELADPYLIRANTSDNMAVAVDGDFSWETVPKAEQKFDDAQGKDQEKQKKAPESEEDRKKKGLLPVSTEDTKDEKATIDEEDEKKSEEPEEKPFELKGLRMDVPKGAFVAIVGRVGSGKSSVLQALIGEMRKTRGSVVFGGKVAYVPQTPWIRNLTLRGNVIFGDSNDDEERFQEVVKACSLQTDINMLPQREHTEIGEKGINLSGGQKARVSLARAAYSHADIVLLDDSLSAVDAYVGKSILDHCILNGPLSTRTRIFATHSLHVLDKTDYIYVMDAGVVVEEGTYQDLMSREASALRRVINEYGSQNSSDSQSLEKDGTIVVNDDEKKIEELVKADPQALMQEEEREIGAVPWRVYGKYLRHAGGLSWAPLILGLLIVTQSVIVGTSVFLGIWTQESIPGFTQSDYIAVYVSLGVAQAALTFFATWAYFFMCLSASLSLFKAAIAGVLRSPISLFDTTPIGRILSRLSKDQDTLDTHLASTMFSLLYTVFTVFGTVFLVFYTFPLLGIIFVPLFILYTGLLSFYRRSSIETKRLDSLLRSQLYASYSETLTGVSTIRAYGLQEQAIKSADDGLNMENKAYFMTVSIQRWLSLRLDLFANILVLGLGLFAAGFRNTVNPSKIGVVLSYTLGLTAVLSEMVSQFAQNEQNMNAVERVLVYTELPSEGDRTTPQDPPAEWPTSGEISFKNVDLAYREGLPLVLKKVSFDVRPGEKVGIVGRTGAGKSSLLQALFRMVNVQSGKVLIDGVDISVIGLDVLRSRLALVPQDSTLFLGTLRENIDPMKMRTDAELISVLQRAWLLPRDGASDATAEAKFSLDATIGDEGSNYSAGEKQLLALARALVKNSKVIILDEATSSVDMETDSKLQRTIRTEFSGSTLLCIAHRLNTIAYYDRVLVMDAGEVAEFDTVLNLFDKEDSIFRSLCDEAKLSRADILRIRERDFSTAEIIQS